MLGNGDRRILIMTGGGGGGGGLARCLVVTGRSTPSWRGVFGYRTHTPELSFAKHGNGKFEELIEEAGPGIAAAHSKPWCAGDFDNDATSERPGHAHGRADEFVAQVT